MYASLGKYNHNKCILYYEYIRPLKYDLVHNCNSNAYTFKRNVFTLIRTYRLPHVLKNEIEYNSIFQYKAFKI